MDTTLTIPSVTGVDLELRIAGPGGRSYAFVIDWHIRFLAAVGWWLVGMFVYLGAFRAATADDLSQAGFSFSVVLPSAAIYFLYHPVLELLMRGRTPGKRIAGVRLVRRDGGIPGPGALLIRNAFRLIDCLPFAYVVGLTSTLLTEQALRIGDIAAGTLLVYDEARPKEMLGGVSSASVAKLGLRNAEIVRDLLARWASLRPDARAELAGQLLGKLGTDVPAGDDARRAQLERLLAG